MRRVCSTSWLRRWRGLVWCIICLVLLAILAIWDSVGYLIASSDDLRTRHCPPPPVEVDGCASWRPLQVPHPTCDCTRELLVLHDTCTDFVATDTSSYLSYTKEYYGTSECSDQATLRGPRQHVVSLSLEQMTSDDMSALNQTINQVNSAYKGWVIRIYTSSKNHNSPALCSLICNNPNIDLCDVSQMPQPPPTSYSQGRMGWRWSVLGDPLVSVWAVRYLEIEILEREAHAVTQFINSDKCWHVMKDHKSHAKSAIGSGLLGGKTSWGSTELQHIRQRLTHQIQSISDEETILEEALIPLMGHDVMTHDSVTCLESLEPVPYPSRRYPGQWVGMPAQYLQPEKLVLKPKKHHNLNQSLSDTHNPKTAVKKIMKGSKYASKQSESKSQTSTKSPDKSYAEVAMQKTKSKSKHKVISSILQSTKNSKEIKVPIKESLLPVDVAKEREINQENGIIVCPQACRPHLHPDWQYC
ncbi:hypothetical protein SK128_000196 [Halocaridina rubra]|uniref:Uncharacterized protein n=1 Tax=Halocaridina rubra TaxID=373956 RepID=A0AAN8WNY3_HALRR